MQRPVKQMTALQAVTAMMQNSRVMGRHRSRFLQDDLRRQAAVENDLRTIVSLQLQLIEALRCRRRGPERAVMYYGCT